MFAYCPSCRQPAVLDLRMSMFNLTHDSYSCAHCALCWKVEKRTGRLVVPVSSHDDGVSRQSSGAATVGISGAPPRP